MTINGRPIIDPAPGGPKQKIPYIYADDKGTTKSDIANPNSYIIVPAGFGEAQARAYADEIARIKSIPGIGGLLARAKMAADFRQDGSQDLQRNQQWGIPQGSIVPAFVSGASYYLGLVSGQNGIPIHEIELVGGRTNLGADQTGPYGVSWQNHRNLVQGQSEVMTRDPIWLTNNFGYGSQGQIPAGQIGAGTGARRFTMRSVDPRNPMQPAAPQDPSGSLGLVSSGPMPDWPLPPPIFNTR